MASCSFHRYSLYVSFFFMFILLVGAVPAALEEDQDMPSRVDWRDIFAVTPVQEQGDCECSWAYAAVGAVEGIFKIHSNVLLSLSVQQVVDCAPSTDSCQGGSPHKAFEYIMDNGITRSYNYPYLATKGSCRKGLVSEATITDYNWLKSTEQDLLYAVAKQPIVVGLYSDDPAFRYYKGGIFKGPCKRGGTMHTLLAIGYGTSLHGEDYWLLKNSWGTEWGEAGYMRIIRGKALCGFPLIVMYPNIY